MDPRNTALMEQLATHSPLPLRPLADLVRRKLGWPPFALDCENDTSWAESQRDCVLLNLAMPAPTATLHAWNPALPRGCNLAVSLSCSDLRDATPSSLVPAVASGLANLLGQPVHHVQTWRGPGRVEPQSVTYPPQARCLPFVADEARQASIRQAMAGLSLGMDALAVHALAGLPDALHPLYPPNKSPGVAPIGWSYTFLLTRMAEHGSAVERGERLVRLGFDLDERLVQLDLIEA